MRPAAPIMQSLLRSYLFITLFTASALALPMEAADSKKLADLLELRGYTRIGGALEFSVYNKEKKRSEWLRIGEEDYGYTIESYDPETNTIVIRYQGQVGTLLLQASKITDYVEPEPVSQAELVSAAPARSHLAGSERNGERAGTQPDLQRPAVAPRNRQDTREGDEAPLTFMSGTSRSRPQPSPSSPSPPSEEKPGNGAESPAASYWAKHSSPPPLPPTAPPGYSPEG